MKRVKVYAAGALVIAVALAVALGPAGGYRIAVATATTGYETAYDAVAWPAVNGVLVVRELHATRAQGGLGQLVVHARPLHLSGVTWGYWMRHGAAWRYALLQRPDGAAVRGVMPWEVGAVLALLAFIAVRLGLTSIGLARLRPSTVHGSARWAEWREIAAMRPRRRASSFILGTVRHGLRRRAVALVGGEQYVNLLLVGPAGSGKSSGPIKTNLLREDGSRSIVVTDPKGECYEDTGGALARSHDVLRLDFLDAVRSCGWNPLATCHDYLTARTFADTWIANTGTDAKTPYWQNTAALLITATILHLDTIARTKGRVATLPELADVLTRNSIDAIEKMLLHSPGPEACAVAGQYMQNTAGNASLRASVGSEFHPRFALLNDPRVRAITSRNDVNVAGMADPAQRPTALYVVLPPGRDRLLKPLTAVLFTQLFTILLDVARTSPSQALARPVFLYMDELGTIGEIAELAGWLNVCRQARIGCVAAVQTLAQLAAIYGHDGRQTLTAAFFTKVALAGVEQEDALWFSAAAGQATVRQENVGETQGRGMWRADRGSRGVSEAARPLIYADEISGMSPREMLVLMRARRPFKVRQLRWYTVRALRRLAALPTPGEGTPPHGFHEGGTRKAEATSEPAAGPAPAAAGGRPIKVGKALDWTHLP